MMITIPAEKKTRTVRDVILPKDTMETFLCVQKCTPASHKRLHLQVSNLQQKWSSDQNCIRQKNQPLKTTLEIFKNIRIFFI
ncbi:hypothetical protein Tco_0708106 [Tanacetum coccineum]